MQRLFEQWGAFVSRRPWMVLLIAIAFVSTGVAGMARISVMNGVQQIFEGKSETYLLYEAMQELFPPSQMDATVVISDPQLLTSERLAVLRDLHFEMALHEGVEGVVSLFSARRVGGSDEDFPPLVPNDIPEGEAFIVLANEIVDHPLIRNRLVSEDGSTAIFNVGLDPAENEGDDLRATIESLSATVNAVLSPHGLSSVMTGTPVMRAEIDAVNSREELLLKLAGFLAGSLVCFAFFRRISYTLIALTVPVSTVMMTFGLLGWLGIPLTVALQIVGPLVTIVAFNNAMHMLFAILKNSAEPGLDSTPVARAVGQVGPASLMTSLTSAIAFSALTLTDSDVIQSFGALAAFGTVASFSAVISILPAVATLAARIPRFFDRSMARSDVGGLAALCTAGDRRVGRYPRVIVFLGTLLIVAFAFAQASLSPRHVFKDNIPIHSDTRIAISTLDAAFGGSQPLRVLVRWPAHDPESEAALLDHLDVLETRLSSLPEIGSVLSLATLSNWLKTERPDLSRDFDELSEGVPETLRGRLFDRNAGAALITAMVPDQSTEANRVLVERIGEIVDERAAVAPRYSFDVTGIVALTAFETGKIINSLQLSLFAAIVVIIALIGITFRRLWPAVISILPNVFPIGAGGAYLALRGGEIDFSGAIAMTVAFGLAVDDTIHMLYRFRREQAEGATVAQALERTIAKIGPVLVVSTVVLVAGISVLFLSELPMNGAYAQITIFIFIAALVGDLVLLPALIRVFRSWIPDPPAG